MKKYLLALGLLLSVTKAHAYQEVVNVYRSTANVTGVFCSTGTATLIDDKSARRYTAPGINRGRAVITNLDPTSTVFIGFNSIMTDSSTLVTSGFPIAAGGNRTVEVGNNITLYCVTTNGQPSPYGASISVEQYGYK